MWCGRVFWAELISVMFDCERMMSRVKPRWFSLQKSHTWDALVKKAQQWVPISRESDSIWMNACKVRERSDIWLWLASAVTEKNVSPHKEAVLASALDARLCSPTTTGFFGHVETDAQVKDFSTSYIWKEKEANFIHLNIENKTHTSRRSERPSLMRFTFHVVRSLEHPEEP